MPINNHLRMKPDLLSPEALSGIAHIQEICQNLKPLLVIKCLTYNHGDYLSQALDGFIMQKTNFPFVVIVHEDASTDGTANILREYASRYPKLILPIFESENQYSMRDGSLDCIVDEAVKVTGAKYIAFCEGDDYWTDPLKLQKQVDYLEEHPDCSLCFNAIQVINEFTGKKYPLAKVETRIYTANEIIETLLLQTASVIFRMNVLNSERYVNIKADKGILSGDICLYLAAASCGHIYCIADYMSIYRVNSGGITNSMRRDPFIFVNEVKLFIKYFGDKYSRSLKNNLAKGYIRTLLIGIKSMKAAVIYKSIIGLTKYIWYLNPKYMTKI